MGHAVVVYLLGEWARGARIYAPHRGRAGRFAQIRAAAHTKLVFAAFIRPVVAMLERDGSCGGRERAVRGVRLSFISQQIYFTTQQPVQPVQQPVQPVQHVRVGCREAVQT